MKITPLLLLNFVLLQWVGIRLARQCVKVDDELVQTGWSLHFGPLPLTGWWSRYWPGFWRIL